jgi:hypothetical protein
MPRMTTLRQAGMSFGPIAAALERDGFRPPKRPERFTGSMVARLLSPRGLHGPRPRAMEDGIVLAPHAYWLTDFARVMDMPIATIHQWQRRGWVHSRKVAVAAGRWAIWADNDALERLRRLRAHKRTWPDPRYPSVLTMPKPRDNDPSAGPSPVTAVRPG